MMYNPHLSWLQSDAVGSGCLESREPAQVRMQDVHPAEDTGLLVGDPGRVEFRRVLGGKQVPALPACREHHSDNSFIL